MDKNKKPISKLLSLKNNLNYLYSEQKMLRAELAQPALTGLERDICLEALAQLTKALSQIRAEMGANWRPGHWTEGADFGPNMKLKEIHLRETKVPYFVAFQN